MVYIREVLEHLVRHSEGYHTPAARQEHLDALKVLDHPDPENVIEPAAGTGQEGS
jgi:hypothetical protein